MTAIKEHLKIVNHIEGNDNKLNTVYYSCLMFIEWYNENVLK